MAKLQLWTRQLGLHISSYPCYATLYLAMPRHRLSLLVVPLQLRLVVIPPIQRVGDSSNSISW